MDNTHSRSTFYVDTSLWSKEEPVRPSGKRSTDTEYKVLFTIPLLPIPFLCIRKISE